MSFQHDEWEPLEQIAKDMGTSRNAVIEQLWRWWIGVPGAELPERPSRELVQRAIEAWRAEHGE